MNFRHHVDRDFGVVRRKFLTLNSITWYIKPPIGHLPLTQFTQGDYYSTELALLKMNM